MQSPRVVEQFDVVEDGHAGLHRVPEPLMMREFLAHPTRGDSRRSSPTWGCGQPCLMPRYPMRSPSERCPPGAVFTLGNAEREVMTQNAPVEAPISQKASPDQASALLHDKYLDRSRGKS